MKISHQQVAKVARLARLELAEAEVEGLAADLSRILGYIAKLDELDTDEVQPTSHVVAVEAPMREDEVTNEARPEDAVANAPEHEDGLFVVPSIIE